MAEHYSMFEKDPDLREIMRRINEEDRNKKRLYRQFKWIILFCIIGLVLTFIYVIVKM